MYRFALSLLLLTGCDDPFMLEAKSVSVCQHLPSQRFQVTPAMRAEYARLPPELQQRFELERTFDFEVLAQLPPELEPLVDAHFALTSVRMTVVNEEDDLGFIHAAKLELEDRTFEYVRSEAAPRSISWNGEGLDLAGYLEAGEFEYSVSLAGSLPPGDVLVDLDACAVVDVKFDYL